MTDSEQLKAGPTTMSPAETARRLAPGRWLTGARRRPVFDPERPPAGRKIRPYPWHCACHSVSSVKVRRSERRNCADKVPCPFPGNGVPVPDTTGFCRARRVLGVPPPRNALYEGKSARMSAGAAECDSAPQFYFAGLGNSTERTFVKSIFSAPPQWVAR